MRYREEAIECVKDYVLQVHKQIYALFFHHTDPAVAEQFMIWGR